MEQKNKTQEMLRAGDVTRELNEIKRIQEDTPYVLTLVTNTCSDFYTVICC